MLFVLTLLTVFFVYKFVIKKARILSQGHLSACFVVELYCTNKCEMLFRLSDNCLQETPFFQLTN